MSDIFQDFFSRYTIVQMRVLFLLLCMCMCTVCLAAPFLLKKWPMHGILPGLPSLPSSHVHILVTNDDGIASAGLDALAHSLSSNSHKVTVVAPSINRSGTGMKTSASLPHVSRGTTTSGMDAYVCTGYPSDCVLWALKNLTPPPTVIVSGINDGLNPGDPSCGSGTIGAVRTGLQHSVPGIAVSQDNYERDTAPRATFTVAIAAVMKALEEVLQKRKAFVNINVHDGKAVQNVPATSCTAKV